MVSVHHPGSTPSRRGLLLGVPGQAQACSVGGAGGCRQKVSWPRPWATSSSIPDTSCPASIPATSSRTWSFWTTWDSTGSLPQRSACLYELILNRHRAFSFVITSNRALPHPNRYSTKVVASTKMLPKTREAATWAEASPRWRSRKLRRRSGTGVNGGDKVDRAGGRLLSIGD